MNYLKTALLLAAFSINASYPVCKTCPVHCERKVCKYCGTDHPRRISYTPFELESPWRAGCQAGWKYEESDKGPVKIYYPEEFKREEKDNGVISVTFP